MFEKNFQSWREWEREQVKNEKLNKIEYDSDFNFKDFPLFLHFSLSLFVVISFKLTWFDFEPIHWFFFCQGSVAICDIAFFSRFPNFKHCSCLKNLLYMHQFSLNSVWQWIAIATFQRHLNWMMPIHRWLDYQTRG